MRMHKKGSLEDIMIVMVMLFVFAITIIFGYKFLDAFNTEIQTMDEIDSYGKGTTTKALAFYPGILDNSFLFLTIGMGIAALMLAALVRIHPVFLFFYFIALAIVIIMAGVFSNAYQELASDANMIGVAGNLTFTSAVLTYFPLIIGVLGSILAIVMYKGYREYQ